MSGKVFAWDARDYARNSRIQEEYGRKHIGLLELSGGEAVLDIGCGDGRLTAALAQRVPRGRVVGVDSSPEMIAAARETQQPLHPNLSFQRVDATALPFRAEFDLVFSTSALHWVKDHLAVLRGISQALKPHGKLYLTFAARGTLGGLQEVLNGVVQEPSWRACFEGFESPYGFYGTEEYGPWLEQCGFMVERLELVHRDVAHAGREAFEGWLRTTGMPYAERIEPEKRPAFLREVIDRYVERSPADAAGAIHVPMVNLLVKARRRDSQAAGNDASGNFSG